MRAEPKILESKIIPEPPEVYEPPAPQPMPLPSDFKTMLLAGIFILLALTLMNVASSIVIPVVLAVIFKLVLQPVLRFLTRLYLPRYIAAAAIVICLIASVIGMGTLLSGPAASWGEKVPKSLPQMQEQLKFLKKPVEDTQKMLVKADDFTESPGEQVVAVAVKGTRFSDKVFDGTQALLSGFFTTMLLLYFLLAAGDTFLRRLVEVLPRFRDKRQAVDISQQIEQDISGYLLTITTMNLLVGASTGLVMWLCGIEDPLLWGTLAFFLNYLPILGPMMAVTSFVFIGLMSIPEFWAALLPAALYMVIHVLEGSFITPLILAKRFTLNPVLVVLSLVFWYWMWGFAGAILAVPMLAITKIICARIPSLSAFGHFLEG